jgi:hypothetical protein
MSDSSPPKERNRDSALAFTWGQYRVFAATSRALKAELSAWRLRVLILSITGAILGTLCQQSTAWGLAGGKFSWLPNFFGILSAVALGSAAYFGKELLNPEKERNWVRARSMAESLKAESYLFATNAHPYDKDDAIDQLFARTEELLESAGNLRTETISADEKRKRLIPVNISSEHYIQMRVNDQIDNFYYPKSSEHEKTVDRGKWISLTLGALAVILGAVGATGWTAAWVAVITTMTLAISAYLYAGRYLYLVISYQATARRLEMLRSRWQASGKTDSNVQERNQFILDCEEAISVENSAWMAEWTKDRKKANIKARE